MNAQKVYQKLSAREHVLVRPDTYVGSTEPVTEECSVFHDGTMTLLETTYTPALFKIFDEVLVNAADNVQKGGMKTLEVSVSDDCTVSILNDGAGIPVVEHEKEGVYIPELVFGHLLTSSNYDDSQKRLAGGRNGYGAKLANIFSTEFIVEACDGRHVFRQTFSANMTEKSDPLITKVKRKPYTRITFTPDFSRLGVAADIASLFQRRTVDMAGVLPKEVSVSYNEVPIQVSTFEEYARLYVGPDEPMVSVVVNKRWFVCVALSKDQKFHQTSFVNCVATSKGGKHVSHIVDQITDNYTGTIKKRKRATASAAQVRNQIWVFISCFIENPVFDSQTKEHMTLPPSKFGSVCTLNKSFIKKIDDMGLRDRVEQLAVQREMKDLDKTSSKVKRTRLTGIVKLDDANFAGGRQSRKTTLILTEGDSAKALAVSGVGSIPHGRDLFGVFPLKGKLLNVRDASPKVVAKNEEIKNLVQIMGLRYGETYTDTKTLRYGRLMIFTDQDVDGSHIKGLLINFIHHFWPSLLKVKGFMVQFITPIVKVTKGKVSHDFFSLPMYEKWLNSMDENERKGFKSKYYKGLGTSTAQEAKAYFAELDMHVKPFDWVDDNKDGDRISLAFSKDRVNDRKVWLRNTDDDEEVYDHTAMKSVPYNVFVDKELIVFSKADNIRSIPSVLDGLKPGQRKVLYAAFKRNLTTDVKVAQFAGYISEQTEYHHGEASLTATIVNMAQDFVGSNNLNLLVPSGQFGTRLQGGKDSASPRYIFTRLNPMTRRVFIPVDDTLLTAQYEDGMQIEPVAYIPIIPMALVNSGEGIGTGFSTYVPPYAIEDIVAAVRRWIKDEPYVPLVPSWKGFKGTVVDAGDGVYETHGVMSRCDNTVVITELPVRSWTNQYKEYLEKLMESDKIVDFNENHSDTTVHFEIKLSDKMVDAEKLFNLVTRFRTTNMVLFSPNGDLKRYESVEAILYDFCAARRNLYIERRGALIGQLISEIASIDETIRFLSLIVRGELVLSVREGLDERMAELNLPVKLLDLPMSSMTRKKMDALETKRVGKSEDLVRVEATSWQDMWIHELTELYKLV